MAIISRRGFLRAARNALIGGAVGSLGIWKYVKFEAGWFKLSFRSIFLPDLPESFNGTRLIHLSDIHFNPWTTPERFSEVVELVNRQSPDVIAITGDFIDSHTDRKYIADYVTELSKLTAAEGIYAVLGNHDHWQNAPLVLSLIHI